MKEDQRHIELMDLAIKKLANEASREELERLSFLLEEDPSNLAFYDEHVRTWEMTGKVKGITNLEVQQEWQRLDQAIEAHGTQRLSFANFKWAAAIALLLLSSLLGYNYLPFFNTTEVVAESMTEELLKDGSTITLSPQTKLTYTKEYNQEKREVKLIGQAFFEVTKNKEKPFIVRAENTAVRVLGTSFNVRAEQNSPVTEVVVVSGKVEVSHSTDRLTLLPGEKVIVNKKSGQLFKIENDDPNFQAWRTKKFTFSNSALSAVSKSLSEVYRQPIKLSNKGLENCPVTVSFEGQDLDTILSVLANTLDITVKKTGKGYVLSGEGCE